MRELSSVPPRVVPPTRYGLHDRPAHTRSYTCALGWIDGDDPETRPWDWNSHAHRYAANSNIGGEAETMASALLEIPRPTTRRGPGLPEPAADDAIRTLPADVFAPSTPTTRRVHGVPVEAYPIHEPGYPNVIDRETGFTHQESSPRYTEDQDLEITAVFRSFARSTLDRGGPLTVDDFSAALKHDNPAYESSVYSAVNGFRGRTGIAASESLRSQLLAPTAERAAFSFGVDLTSLRSPERVRDENQPPVSPTSRDPHSRSSIAGILATGEGISAGGGPAQYSDLAHLHRTQGPAIGSSPVERLGSQDIYSNASVQRDSLRGSAGETMTRTGPMMGKNGKDEEERKIGEKQADEAGTVGH
ncbi:hypothetical protein LTR29_008297 [Friedmanniomyces endolithicus]|nr:hypothetical protein LTR29_008297 [Friedmanniomyces endolithicus]